MTKAESMAQIEAKRVELINEDVFTNIRLTDALELSILAINTNNLEKREKLIAEIEDKLITMSMCINTNECRKVNKFIHEILNIINNN